MKKVYLYKGFERFWHWAQALLILFLMITGYEIHGSYHLFGYEFSVRWHDIAAWAFLVLIVFSMFWHITTGEWKQYVPTRKNLRAQIEYYLTGIFRNAPHPTGKRVLSKLNPLQRLTYTGLKMFIIPLMVFSGLLYMFFNYPDKGVELSSLETVALLHTFGAYALIAFIIVHLYLITTGRTIFSNLMAMITGWEELEEEEVKEVVKDVLYGAEQIIKSTNHRNGKKDNAEVQEMISEVLSENGHKGLTK
ncbi:MAG: cytochrome b/b6 domain-containing protein [Bacteroidota bacterium]|nr:cytochrome b/b6 domain-containing protein [Bacteroidota bacterium]